MLCSAADSRCSCEFDEAVQANAEGPILDINPTYAAWGAAIKLTTGKIWEVDPNLFPEYWFVMTREQAKLPKTILLGGRGASAPRMISGTGSPEGSAKAPPGSIYASENVNVYRKSTGTGNTGWLAL